MHWRGPAASAMVTLLDLGGESALTTGGMTGAACSFPQGGESPGIGGPSSDREAVSQPGPHQLSVRATTAAAGVQAG